MITAFMIAGFETWDITMSDLLSGSISLDKFQVQGESKAFIMMRFLHRDSYLSEDLVMRTC